VSVTGGSVSNVTLTLEPPRKVTGRFLFEGRAKPHSPKDISVELITIRGPHGADTTVTANDDGTFDIDNLLPGRYAINVALNGVGVVPWALTSAVVGGVDILDTFLEVPRDRDVRDLTITFRDRETELSGAVIDSAGHSAGERIVVVFPSDDKLWAGHMRVQAMPLSSDGGYAFRELRPGRYLVAVVDGVETGEWLDAAFLRNLIPSAVPVTLAEGERRVQDLRVR
jgi:uncharacterized protein (DUF2141 family)